MPAVITVGTLLVLHCLWVIYGWARMTGVPQMRLVSYRELPGPAKNILAVFEFRLGYPWFTTQREQWLRGKSADAKRDEIWVSLGDGRVAVDIIGVRMSNLLNAVRILDDAQPDTDPAAPGAPTPSAVTEP